LKTFHIDGNAGLADVDVLANVRFAPILLKNSAVEAEGDR
jgi:hypothetical protein